MRPFFIGWLGLPRSLWRFTAAIVVLTIAFGAGLAAALVQAQPPHLTGTWDPSGERVIEGELVTRPYPMVRVAANGGRTAYSVLLVDEWKFGLPLSPEFHDGDRVRVTGFAIQRGDVTVLQVDDKLTPLGHPDTGSVAVPLHSAGIITIAGEIVDSKCWTGAMNPGEGKAHKGCGSLCLLGDIPALFVAFDGGAGRRWYVIADRAGGSLGEGLRYRIGERLTLTGEVLDAPDLHELRVDPAALLP